MKALICGVSGQDGAYLAAFLLKKGYEVFGTSRDAQTSSFGNLRRLGIADQVRFVSLAVKDFRSVLEVMITIQPDEVCNLATQSSVGVSFEQPVETMESISIGTLNLLEAIRFVNRPVKLYSAGSSQCFGDSGEEADDESTLLHSRSTQAFAKASTYWEVAQLQRSLQPVRVHEYPLQPLISSKA